MPAFPFTAIVGQDDLKRALLLCAVDPAISGVLALGDRGTGKSTVVRSLGSVLALAGIDAPVVDLPLGATEDRVVGALDIRAALDGGAARFSPGLLARAHGGFLYIDEVNLLDDFLVDLLLDVAASGTNIVERDGISHTHPARFVLVGSGNPEEGSLRPQLEDRFGLSAHVATITDTAARCDIVRRRIDFDANPAAFVDRYSAAQQALATQLADARQALPGVAVDDRLVSTAVTLCVEAGAVGHRAEVVLIRAARALAALHGHTHARPDHLRTVAVPVLRHRISRDPFDPPARTDARVSNTVAAVLGHHRAA